MKTSAGELSAAIDGPDSASSALVLGHGAGASMDSDFMLTITKGLADRGIRVARFNFGYMEAGRKSPDKQAVLERTFSEVVAELRPRLSGERLFVGGKSLGGRIASHVAADGLDCDGVVFFGYPLHPPGKPDRLRVEHLHRLNVPVLFIEGTRDPFCPLSTLTSVLNDLSLSATVAVIEDGDHSLKVRASSGRTTAQAWEEVVDVAVRWLRSFD